MRSFGTEKQISKLRLKGNVAKAFRSEKPPSLPARATDHFLRVLRDRGGHIEDGTQRSGKARSTVLTSAERDRLLWAYVPDEQDRPRELRKSSHKWIWRYMKKRDWKRFDACLEDLRAHQLPYDEVTYNLVMFGVLLHPRRDDEAIRQVFSEMVEASRFHPALLRLQGGFIDSYFELKEVDAAPNPWNLLKAAKTFWQISVNFKRKRVKDVRAKLASVAEAQRRQLLGVAQLEDMGSSGGADELDAEMSDGDMANRSRVKFPAKRPRQMKGVHRGSGVPNRRRHRWKH